MRTYTTEELNEILEKHAEWLHSFGRKGKRAYLTGAYLTGADLTGADLKGAYLTGADLTGADLTGAYLKGAYLKGAYLTGAYLTGADLTGADLKGAYLTGADLTGADLTGAYLTGADIIPLACPSDGSFIGWKKAAAVTTGNYSDRRECVVKIEVPEDAKRSSATTNKCRCDKAKVLAAFEMDGSEIDPEHLIIYSQHDGCFSYKVGDIITPRLDFEENRWEECASGIHFFINRSEAERW